MTVRYMCTHCGKTFDVQFKAVKHTNTCEEADDAE